VVAAIGLATGAGYYYAAVVTTVFVLISLWILNKVEKKWMGGKVTKAVQIELLDRPGSLAVISAVLKEKGMEIRKLTIHHMPPSDTGEERIQIRMFLRLSKPEQMVLAADELQKIAGVMNVSME
jgi:putative Mg2+ transporter-C (MgtC) family protein